MMKTIILHGHLAEKHPDPIRVEASSVAEAVRSLSQIEALSPPDGQPWPVRIEGVDNEIHLFGTTDRDEIHIYPETAGAGGRGGVVQVMLGVAMVALAVANPAFLGTLGGIGITQGSLFLAGGLMITGGLLNMMLPTPKEQSDDSSQVASGLANTVRIGTTIPILFGAGAIGGHYLSYDADAKDWSAPDFGPRATVRKLPRDRAIVGVYPLPGTTSPTNAADRGTYVEHDKTPVPHTIVLPVFSSPVTGPSNVPVSGWVV